jgi:hypothetical protein
MGAGQVPLSGNRRLDAKTKSGKTATEVERSGSSAGLERAAARLKSSRAKQKVLQVHNQDMGKAVDAMRKVGISGTVKNMGGTKRRSVPKP